MLKDELAFPEEQVQSARLCEKHLRKAEARHTAQGWAHRGGPECWGRGIRPPPLLAELLGWRAFLLHGINLEPRPHPTSPSLNSGCLGTPSTVVGIFLL